MTLGHRTFALPVIAANMTSVVDVETCLFLARENLFYIMHRFSISPLEFAKFMIKNDQFVSISVGVNKASYDALKELLDPIQNLAKKIEYITIDVANAWSEKTHKMIQYIKKHFSNAFLIVGNVATLEAVNELEKWGAECVKVGIGPGKSCITKNKTGFYRPIVSTLLETCQNENIPIIADGGIIEHGDIAKGIACGCSCVMAGALFAGYDQSAGDVIQIDNRMYKEYYGNASEDNKNNKRHVEGKKILEAYKGNMLDLVESLKDDLQSSISYCGGVKLYDLYKTKIGYVKQ